MGEKPHEAAAIGIIARNLAALIAAARDMPERTWKFES